MASTWRSQNPRNRSSLVCFVCFVVALHRCFVKQSGKPKFPNWEVWLPTIRVTIDVREVLLGKLVMVLSRATPEELAAIYYFATGKPLESAGCGVRGAELKRGRADGSSTPGAKGGRAYVFRWTGRHWEVIFAGGRAFRLRNTLGARYLDYLLHKPNDPTWALGSSACAAIRRGEYGVRRGLHEWSRSSGLNPWESVKSVSLPEGRLPETGRFFFPP